MATLQLPVNNLISQQLGKELFANLEQKEKNVYQPLIAWLTQVMKVTRGRHVMQCRWTLEAPRKMKFFTFNECFFRVNLSISLKFTNFFRINLDETTREFLVHSFLFGGKKMSRFSR